MNPRADPAHGEPIPLWPVRGRRPPGDPRYHRPGEPGSRAALDGALCGSLPPAGEPPGTGACPQRFAGTVAPVLGLWSYLVVYRAEKLIEIVAIVHGARDVPSVVN